jgi:hypothetical protein
LSAVELSMLVAIRFADLGVMHRSLAFPFPGDRFPDALGAVIQKTVLAGTHLARYVAHTADNDWIIGDDLTDPNPDAASIAAHIRHVVDVDPTLEPLATLPRGYQARRRSREDPWDIQPHSWLADDEPFVPE